MIAKRRLIHVHRQIADAHAGFCDELQRVIVSDLRQIIGVRKLYRVEATVLEFDESHGVIRNCAENEPV